MPQPWKDVVAARDRAIIDAVHAGEKYAVVAAQHGVNASTVSRILARRRAALSPDQIAARVSRAEFRPRPDWMEGLTDAA